MPGAVRTADRGLCCELCGEPLGYRAMDRLTGLPGRWEWDHQAGHALQGHAHRPGVVLLVDLDRFQAINDAHGHLAGDTVLTSVALALRNTVRDGDVLGRFGGHDGDEFLVFLPATRLEQGLSVARDIRTRIRTIVVTVRSAIGHTVVIEELTGSIGVGLHHPGLGTGLRELVSEASLALQTAKRSGRDRISLPPVA
ncbi:GGDEF domain-containing protein [Amycolatopsis albispora]|uniref:GGDEF domain-containing protein n=1 Tax=Amycolatopsis albispora TaxID=1804986 RepID=A0A344LHL8_9PSEU|nr:GGDEF domain-containing protein [Amycolatopsis albispora]AXB47542.1 hypothetical protein A4R43_37990 [Amycolatopsis albispora]